MHCPLGAGKGKIFAMSENPTQNSSNTAPQGPTPPPVEKATEGIEKASVRRPIGPFNNPMFGLPPLPLPDPFKEQGSGGTAVWGGFIQVKEENPKWVGPEKYRQAAEIVVNVSVVAAGVHYFLNLISHPRWHAKPRDPKSHEAKEAADWVNELLEDTEIPWSNIVRHAAMYRFHGFSIQEWIAKKRDDGLIGLRTVEPRPQHTIEQWALDDRGTVLGVFQRNPQTGELLGLPRFKLLYIVEDSLTDNPEGLGVFRHLAESYARLKRLQEIEVRGYERDLRGIPIGRAPLSHINQAVEAGLMDKTQAKRLIEGIESIIQMQVRNVDTGVLLDSATYTTVTAGGPQVSPEKMWDLSLLSGPGQGLSEIANSIERIQREIARVIGVEHLMLGDQGGSRAVAQDKSRNVYLIASSVLKLIVKSAENDILRPIWGLNSFDPRIMPKLHAEDIAPRDALEVTTALARMAQSGAVLAPNDPAINDVRDLLGISHALESEDMILSDEIPLPREGEETQPLPRNGKDGDKPSLDEIQGSLRDEMQRLPRTSSLMQDPGERSV